MNTEPPIACFQVEHQPRRPGYARRRFRTQPQEFKHGLDGKYAVGQIIRLPTWFCFGQAKPGVTFLWSNLCPVATCLRIIDFANSFS